MKYVPFYLILTIHFSQPSHKCKKAQPRPLPRSKDAVDAEIFLADYHVVTPAADELLFAAPPLRASVLLIGMPSTLLVGMHSACRISRVSV